MYSRAVASGLISVVSGVKKDLLGDGVYTGTLICHSYSCTEASCTTAVTRPQVKSQNNHLIDRRFDSNE